MISRHADISGVVNQSCTVRFRGNLFSENYNFGYAIV
jgi:hypothetical protein